MTARLLRSVALVGLLMLVGLSALPAVGHAASPTSQFPFPRVSGAIHGPAALGEGLKGTYTIVASGGPAEAPNTTTVGVYRFNATLSGANTTGAFVAPVSGVLVNGSAAVTVQAPRVVEQLTLFVLVTSGYQGQNASNNLSYGIRIVAPFNVTATLVVPGSASVGPFGLTVTLDGVPVGAVSVPALTGKSTYPISFQYVATELGAGWHTFGISLAKEHGLVTFAGGSESFSTSFYVTGPPPDYTTWYLTGTVAFAGTIFIWATRVGARRRGRSKK